VANVNSVLRDRAIRHALALGRYSKGLSDRLIALLDSQDTAIVERLASGLASIEERGGDLNRSSWARLSAILDDVRVLNSAIYERMGSELRDELEQFSASEASFQHASITTAIPVEVAVSAPSAIRLRAIVTESPMQGRLLSEYLGEMEANRVSRITTALRQGMIDGETTDQLVRRIRGTKAARYTDGILDISRRSANSIVRTAVNHVSNAAAQETWKAAGNVVSKWQFLATLDTRTTTTCAGLDGTTWDVGQGPIPPRHIRCRSITVAVTKTFREMGIDADELSPAKRASMDGQVAGGTPFDGWLKSKDAATQDKVLGKTRAEWFRDGKLDLADFIKEDGQVLTLEALRKAHRDILG
jgi:SPP1 gp7 family putative phage head morphogenesis protein